jgi:hypothetical protein
MAVPRARKNLKEENSILVLGSLSGDNAYKTINSSEEESSDTLLKFRNKNTGSAPAYVKTSRQTFENHIVCQAEWDGDGRREHSEPRAGRNGQREDQRREIPRNWR